MLVANSFDLWQKDSFFSAAEEVQKSADLMESAYRAWLKSRKEALVSQHLDKLSRELQMALGTAKWQLEEFERAVCLSYRNKVDDITITRHKEFVSAIEDQISRVETALKVSLEVEGKKPFRWVNLDKEESDDLVHFLSGSPGTSQMIKDGHINVGAPDRDHSLGSPVSSKVLNRGWEEVAAGVKDMGCSFELQEREVRDTEDEISNRAGESLNNLRVWNSPDRNALEIVVDTENRETNGLIVAMPKEKGSEPLIWRSTALKRTPGKSKTISFPSVAGQIYTFRTSFDDNHFFIRPFRAPLNLSRVEVRGIIEPAYRSWNLDFYWNLIQSGWFLQFKHARGPYSLRLISNAFVSSSFANLSKNIKIVKHAPSDLEQKKELLRLALYSCVF